MLLFVILLLLLVTVLAAVVIVVFNVATFVAAFIIAALGSCCSCISCSAVVKGTSKINHANSQFCLLAAKNAYERN